jgi:hypothetical protein
MSAAPDAGRDDRSGQAEGAQRVDPPPRPRDATETVADRLRAARRARRRSRFRQAIAARRRSASSWVETFGRVWVGLALLVLVGGVAWLEITLSDHPTTSIARSPSDPEPAAGAVADSPVAPTAMPSPTAEPAMPPGPEITVALIEANGPIFGCTLHPRLSDLRARIGDDLVGDCVEDARIAVGGDARQRTTHGELFWQQTDDRAAFTDGAHTWLTGPTGIVRRRNEERFAWESDADDGPRPTRTTHVLPPPLPGAILPARRVVSYYGNPLASGMGVLGEQPPEKLFPRLRAQADAYTSADKDRAAMPALELVAVVAQDEPGPDGLYRLRMETELIERVAGWAEEHGYLLILDVQIGRGKVDDEVRWLLPFLKRPNVHLALDPEFAMPSGHVPGQRIGTMDASAINGALRVLSDLVEAEHVPPKLLVVHRFTEEMVTSPNKIAMDPRVQVVMVMDGFGSPSVKTRQYDELIAQPRVQYTGFKLFYRHDEPLMTPEQVILLDPAPDLVIYQ